jgi:hypothetical protein
MALVLTGCGGGAPSGPAGEITAQMANSFRTTGGERLIELSNPSKADDIGSTFAGSTGARAASLFDAGLRMAGLPGEGTRTTCTVNKGSQKDDDTDDVRDDSTDTYNCNFGSEGTFTLTGNTKVKDRVVNATTGKFPFGGADVTLGLNLNFSSTSGGTTVTGSVNTEGSWGFVFSGSTGTGTVAITQRFTVQAAGQSASGEVGWWVNPWTITPETPTVADWKKKGAASWRSFFRFNVGEANFTLQGTTSNLTYDDACGATRGNSKKYNGGSIEWVDGVGNKVTVTFAPDCSYTWTYNGNPLSGTL